MAGILRVIWLAVNVATNGVNGRIGNKTWGKCECCARMETSTEDVCWLKISEIWKPRFSSTSYIRSVDFVNQIRILCYDILSEKTSLVI